MSSADVLQAIADVLLDMRRTHPLRVGIDGRSAAGKTTFADALAAYIRQRGREVLRASIDDFHRPGHKHRSIKRTWTPQFYYDEGFDYVAFHDLVLQLLGPGGSRHCRVALFDSYRDERLPESWVDVGGDCVAIVDSAFLHRPELEASVDFLVWLEIDFETMIRRACERDTAWVESVEEVERRYRQHWIPTHELYERLFRPQQRAHAVIDNRDSEAPQLRRLALAT
jgi:uridine kinase